MTSNEIKVALALGVCSYQSGSFEKRFAHNIANMAREHPHTPMTERGRAWMWKQARRYRRQLPTDIVAIVPVPPHAKPVVNRKGIRAKAGMFSLKASR